LGLVLQAAVGVCCPTEFSAHVAVVTDAIVSER
jgi:hypothetical protein